MGRKLEGDSGSKKKTGMSVDCLNISRKIPVVKHLFIILHIKGDRIEVFSFMRCMGILSICFFGIFQIND